MTQGIWTPGGPFDRQPQGPVEVDWANPIARGLNFCVVNAFDHAGDKTAARVDVNRSTSPSGVVERFIFNSNTSAISVAGNFASPNLTQLILGRTDGNAPPGPMGVLGVSGIPSVTTVAGGFIKHVGGDFWRFSIIDSGGQKNAFDTSVTSKGRLDLIVGVANGTNVRLFRDGVLKGTAAAGNATGVVNSLSIGTSCNSQSFGGDVALACNWNRALSDAEIASISANPWQLFRDDTSDVLIFDMGAGGGAVTAYGAPASLSLVAASGAATGGASASSALSAVSLSPVEATATGGTVIAGNAAGAFASTGLSAAQASATGAASASGLLDGIDLAPVSGTASGGAIVPGNAAGDLASISLSAAAGSSSAAATAAAVFASLAINPATGAAYGAAVAVGGLPVIALSPVAGTATGGASVAGNASGALAGISLSAITGTANDLEASASPYVAYVPYTNHIAFVPAVSNTALRGL